MGNCCQKSSPGDVTLVQKQIFEVKVNSGVISVCQGSCGSLLYWHSTALLAFLVGNSLLTCRSLEAIR